MGGPIKTVSEKEINRVLVRMCALSVDRFLRLPWFHGVGFKSGVCKHSKQFMGVRL